MRPVAGRDIWQSQREIYHESRIKACEAAWNQAVECLNSVQTAYCTCCRQPCWLLGSLRRSDRKPWLCSRKGIKGFRSHITKELCRHGPECNILLCSLTLLETHCRLLRKKYRDWSCFCKPNLFLLYLLANCWGSCFYIFLFGKY